MSLAPHFYCPGVSLETRSQCFQGAGQWEGFDNTIGYLTVAPGYCSGGKCKVLPLPCAVQSPKGHGAGDLPAAMPGCDPSAAASLVVTCWHRSWTSAIASTAEIRANMRRCSTPLWTSLAAP